MKKSTTEALAVIRADMASWQEWHLLTKFWGEMVASCEGSSEVDNLCREMCEFGLAEATKERDAIRAKHSEAFDRRGKFIDGITK